MPRTRAIKSSVSAASRRGGGRCAAPRRPDRVGLILPCPAQVSLLPPVAAIAATAVAGPSADALIARGWPVARVRRLAQATAFLGPAACLTAAAFSEDGPQTVGAPLLQRGWRAGMHLGWNTPRWSVPGRKRVLIPARAPILWHSGCHPMLLCVRGERSSMVPSKGACSEDSESFPGGGES